MLLAGSETDPPSVAAARLLQIIEARFADGLAVAHEVSARGPAADPESLRLAYLDVLKLCLCELGGTNTSSVVRTQEGIVMSRELSGEQLRMRAAGMDWPLHGLTMLGLARLDDLQACVESVVRDQVPGDIIEAGAWRGGASLFARAVLNGQGETARTVWVADSFQGFPEADAGGDGYDLSTDLAGVDFLAVALEEVRENFARFGLQDGVRFVPGFFQETLPLLSGRPWSIVRVDGDTYESVRVTLESLYPGLSVGGYLVVDDYHSLDECRHAVDEFRERQGIDEPIEAIDWSGARWRRVHPEAAAPAPAETEPLPSDRSPRPINRAHRARVPAIEEVALSEENERLRERLSTAEAELRRLKGSPVAGPRAWLGSQVRRSGRQSP